MNTSQIESRPLGELFGLTDPRVKDVPFPVIQNPGPLAPTLEPAYKFQEEHIRRLLLWIGGVAGRNLLITGPTGCGKSSLIEQLCARLGRELYRVPCHGRLEFSELTGQLTVMTDGSTKFVHGPLPRAMQTGSVLLLDEMNFIHPSAIGALNTILDGGPLLIPETGELIQPHPDFRIVATGNAVDHGDDASLYRGTQRMNLALIQRFLTLKAGYLKPLEEAAMIHRTAPGLPGKAIEVMVSVAEDVRAAFTRGDIESTVSTRTLVKWARVLQVRVPVLVANPEDELRFALQFVLTDALKVEDAKAIEGTLQRRSAGLKLQNPSPGKASASPQMAAAPSVPAAAVATRLHFLVNPNRENKGVTAFWVGVDPAAGDATGLSLNGTIAPSESIRVVMGKDRAWLSQTQSDKRNSRGYRLAVSVVVAKDSAESVARDAVQALRLAKEGRPLVQCQTAEAELIATDISNQMGLLGVTFTH